MTCNTGSVVAALWTLVLGPLASLSADENWPQWRGARLDNKSSEQDLPVQFDGDRNLVWRVAMPGPGGASPVVWEDQVFVTSVDQQDGIWLICIGGDGQEQWRRQLQGENRDSRDGGNAASPSPCTDGQHVWATSTAGYLECFDMDGNPVWSVDLQDRYGDFAIQFGMTSTPVLDQGRLYHQLIHGAMRDRDTTSQGIVAAIDAATGEEIWRHQRTTQATMENKHSYASPVIVRDGDWECLVTHGGDYAVGHSLADGSELWRCGDLNAPENYNPFLRFVSSPVFSEGMLVVPSAKNGPVLSLKTGLSGDVTDDSSSRHWKLPAGTPDVATPVVFNGLVFLARENGALICVDGKSGEPLLEQRMFADRHRSTPVVADGKLYIAGRDGTIHVVTADRECRVLAENRLDEQTLASPAIADGKIYIRTFEALYCFGNPGS